MNGLPPSVETKASTSSNVAAFIILGLFALAFGGMGTAAVVKSVRLLAAGDTHNGIPLGIIGVVFSVVGYGIGFAFLSFRGKSRRDAAAAARYPGQPWMLRPDWAAGKIKSSASSQTIILLIMALAFLGIGGASAITALPQELSKANYTALVILFFPAVGLGFFVAFVRSLMQQLRTGKCVLEMSRVPAPLGGKFAAMIQTGGHLKLQHALHLQFSCIRRVVNRGRNSSTSEYVLWQQEKVYRPEASYPEMRPGHTGIPIYFKLPADQPETSQSGNVSTTWRLEAKSVMSGANFHGVFEVPVFNVAGTEPVSPDEPDPTAAMQMPVEAMRRDERSIIQVSDGPSGREFYFPAKRNWKKACAATFAMIFCDAMLAIMVRFAPIIFTVFIVLFVVFTTVSFFDLWLGSIRITVNSAGLRRVKRWLFLPRESHYAKDDVAQIKTDTNHNLTLLTAAGRRVTLADGVSDLLEAEWLAREMSAALGAPQPSGACEAVTPAAIPIPPAVLQMMQHPRRNSAIGVVIFLIFGALMSAPLLRPLMFGNHLRATHGPIPAPASVPPRPAPITPPMTSSTETTGFSISGSGFKIETLDLGRKAFQNRKFVWEEIPEKFRGWRYTQVRGGANPPAQIHVRAKQDAVLRIITSAHHQEVDLDGWNQTNGEFYYNDKKHVPMIFLQRNVKSGQTITIPQGNWTGCLLLTPNEPNHGTNTAL